MLAKAAAENDASDEWARYLVSEDMPTNGKTMKKTLWVACSIVWAMGGCAAVSPAPSTEIDAVEVATISHNGKILDTTSKSMSPASRSQAMAVERGATSKKETIASVAVFDGIGRALWKFEIPNGSTQTLYGRDVDVRFSVQPCNRVTPVQEGSMADPVTRCVEPNGAPLEYAGVLKVSPGHQVDFEFGSGYRGTLAIVGQ